MILILVIAYLLGFDPATWMWVAVILGEPVFWLTIGALNRNPYGM